MTPHLKLPLKNPQIQPSAVNNNMDALKKPQLRLGSPRINQIGHALCTLKCIFQVNANDHYLVNHHPVRKTEKVNFLKTPQAIFNNRNFMRRTSVRTYFLVQLLNRMRSLKSHFRKSLGNNQMLISSSFNLPGILPPNSPNSSPYGTYGAYCLSPARRLRLYAKILKDNKKSPKEAAQGEPYENGYQADIRHPRLPSKSIHAQRHSIFPAPRLPTFSLCVHGSSA